MRKRKKAKKKGEEVVTPDDEEEMKDFSYRCQKRIEQGTYFHAWFWANTCLPLVQPVFYFTLKYVSSFKACFFNGKHLLVVPGGIG